MLPQLGLLPLLGHKEAIGTLGYPIASKLNLSTEEVWWKVWQHQKSCSSKFDLTLKLSWLKNSPHCIFCSENNEFMHSFNYDSEALNTVGFKIFVKSMMAC